MGCHGAKTEGVEAKSLLRKYCGCARKRRRCSVPRAEWQGLVHCWRCFGVRPGSNCWWIGFETERKRQMLTLIADIWGLKNDLHATYWEEKAEYEKIPVRLGEWRWDSDEEGLWNLHSLARSIKEKVYILPIRLNLLMCFSSIFLVYYSLKSLL